MIDTSENLVIIKGQIKTPEIESCQNHNGNYKIVRILTKKKMSFG